jgi:hypothetical protein
MQIFAYCYPVLAVSSSYSIWHAYLRHQLRRERVLRQRVAFLLWAAGKAQFSTQVTAARPGHM